MHLHKLFSKCFLLLFPPFHHFTTPDVKYLSSDYCVILEMNQWSEFYGVHHPLANACITEKCMCMCLIAPYSVLRTSYIRLICRRWSRFYFRSYQGREKGEWRSTLFFSSWWRHPPREITYCENKVKFNSYGSGTYSVLRYGCRQKHKKIVLSGSIRNNDH